LPPDSREEDKLKHIMTTPVVTMNPKATILSAARIMVQHGFGSVVVIDGKKPVGIITERDITKHVVKARTVLGKPVKNFMKKPLITASPDTGVQQAFELMLANKIRRLPILENDKLIGIVTEKDLMKWVLRVSYEPNIPDHIKMLLETQ
jgi:CBS domain-containing protein